MSNGINMMMKLRNLTLLAIFFSAPLFSFNDTSQEISTNQAYCGFGMFSVEYDKQHFEQQLQIKSSKNTARLAQFIQNLQFTDDDKYLIEKIKTYSPFVIRRMNSKYLCDSLTKNGIKPTGSNTPQVEKNLYSAGQCVFVSFGSPIGQPQWGDVLMTFNKKNLSKGWVTPHSGYYYVSLARLGFTSAHVELNPKVSTGDKNLFRNFVYADVNQWEDIMLNNFLIRYKTLPVSDQELIRNELLSINDRHAFQDALKNLSIKYNLEYYLEGHIDNFVSLNDVNSIQVPAAVRIDLNKNCHNPFQRWKSKIVAY